MSSAETFAMVFVTLIISDYWKEYKNTYHALLAVSPVSSGSDVGTVAVRVHRRVLCHSDREC
jgi:hypothetical protein